MLQTTKIKGLTTELQCQLYFTQFGYNISVPLTEDCKYDFILDIGTRLLRIQVKTASISSAQTGITFSVKSSHLSTKGSISKNYTEQDIDFFATYFNDMCYLIPVSRCGKAQKTLLFNQPAKLTAGDWIKDFEAPKILEQLLNNSEALNVITAESQTSIDQSKIKIKREVIKIHQYSLKGEYLNTYSSYSEAARTIGVQCRNGGSHISEVCSNKRQTAYGFKWKREIIEE